MDCFVVDLEVAGQQAGENALEAKVVRIREAPYRAVGVHD
jgi:hypothetical protein